MRTDKPASTGYKKRKYIGMYFEECNVYSRIYINRGKTAYVGFCPVCARKVTVKIGKDGVSSRFFKSTVQK